MARKKHFILSIDGGGIRGLIPLRILESIESRMAHRGVILPMHACFDLMCGTSTGGLIAAGLSAPKPGGRKGEAVATIADLRTLFEAEARDIFTPSIRYRLARFIANPFTFYDEKLDARPLERLLKERFGWTSIASALTHLVLTAYDIENRKPVFMSNTPQHNGAAPDDYYIWQSVRAATAVPCFFEPARVENLTSKREEALIDGGVFLNDPSIAAYIEARKLGWEPEDIVILSLGTGHAPEHAFPYAEASVWGAPGWFSAAKGAPLQAIATHGQSAITSYQAEWLFGEMGKARFIRLDGVLPADAEDMGNARPGNMITLNGAADRIIRDQTILLDELAEMLIDAKAPPVADDKEIVNAA